MPHTWQSHVSEHMNPVEKQGQELLEMQQQKSDRCKSNTLSRHDSTQKQLLNYILGWETYAYIYKSIFSKLIDGNLLVTLIIIIVKIMKTRFL